VCSIEDQMSNKTDKTFIAEFLLGGVSSICAGCFTNPLDVVKTRFQLQGELMKRGKYQVIYKNVIHGAYTIAKTEGILALQKGLAPALWYQFVMNGFRFGTFSYLENNDWLKNKDGKSSFVKTMLAAAGAGSIGSGCGSPFFMVKTQLQSKAAEAIAVGHQHGHTKMTEAFRSIFRKHGLFGIYQSAIPAMIRTTIGSCVQLTSFSQSRILFDKFNLTKHDSWVSNLSSALSGGICVCIFMTPFDLTLTRLYNQPVDPKTGKGLMYRGLFHTFSSVIKIEGFFGLYKGFTATMLRQLPHSLLSLFFWQEFRKIYYNDLL